MSKHKFTKGKIYTSLSLSLLLTLSMPVVTRASGETNISNGRSLFYTQVINYSMPLIKSTNLDAEDRTQLDFSLKNKLLTMLGLDVENPLSVVAREFNLIKQGDTQMAVAENTSTPFVINPFKLGENNIIKNAQPENNPTPAPSDPSLVNVKVGDAYNPNIKQTLNAAKPQVFIYHTHTTESFKPSEKDNLDPAKNVCAIGDVIANELEKNYGIATIHDTTIHNVQNYNGAYEKSGATLDKYLKKYGDFKLIIDLHRDAAVEKKPMPVTIRMNDKNTARIEFVVGKANKNYSKNLDVSRKLINISQQLFPGFARVEGGTDNGVYYWRSYFNQQKSSNAVLLEVGNEVNTLDEAKNSGYYIARIIAEYLNKK